MSHERKNIPHKRDARLVQYTAAPPERNTILDPGSSLIVDRGSAEFLAWGFRDVSDEKIRKTISSFLTPYRKSVPAATPSRPLMGNVADSMWSRDKHIAIAE